MATDLFQKTAVPISHEEKSRYLQEKGDDLKIAEQRVLETEAEILVAQNKLLVAQSERDAILKDIALFHSLQAPIAKVPLELIHMIFENWDDDPAVRNHTLGLVCATWHKIVWNSASFWSKILLRSTWDGTVRSKDCFIDICYQKSMDNPLDIVLDLSAMVPYAEYIARMNRNRSDIPSYLIPQRYEEVRSLLDGVLRKNEKHTRRWRSLHIFLGDGLEHETPYKTLYNVPDIMENLVDLKIRGNPDKMIHRVTKVPHFPKLRRFTTNQYADLRMISKSYSLLEHLSIEHTGVSRQFLSLASSTFRSLYTLELTITNMKFRVAPPERVQLPRLTSLKLRGEGNVDLSLVQLIDAPGLMHLHLDDFKMDVAGVHCHSLCAPPPELLATISSLLIDGPSRSPSDKAETSASYHALKVTLTSAVSLGYLKLSGGWADRGRIWQIVEEVRAEGHSLQYLKDVVGVSFEKDLATQDEAHYSFRWRFNNSDPLGRIG